MLESIKTIEIIDNDVKKTFMIKRMTAWNQFTYTNKLVGLISATDKINVTVISDLVNGLMRTGVSSGETSEAEMKQALAQGGMTLAFDVVMNIFSNLTEYKQIEILTPLINCLQIMNPDPVQMDFIEGSDRNINLYVSDFVTLYKLAFYVLEFNYGRFFPKADQQSS